MSIESMKSTNLLIISDVPSALSDTESKHYELLEMEEDYPSVEEEKPRIKRKRKDISLETKLQIISAVDRGDKNRSTVARDFQIPLTTLSTLLKNREKVENSQYEGKLLTTRKRLRNGRHEKLDTELVKWYTERRERCLPVSPTILREKAEQIAAVLGVAGFKCSNGWLQRLKERNQLVFDGPKRSKSINILPDTKTISFSDDDEIEEEESMCEETTKEEYHIQRDESFTEEVLELTSDDNTGQPITSFKDETIYQYHEYSIQYDEILDAPQDDDKLSKQSSENVVIIKNDNILASTPLIKRRRQISQIPQSKVSHQSSIDLPIRPCLKEYIEKKDGLPSKEEALYALGVLEKVLQCSDVGCDEDTQNAFNKIQQFTDKSYPKMIQLKINQFFK